MIIFLISEKRANFRKLACLHAGFGFSYQCKLLSMQVQIEQYRMSKI